MLSVSLLAHDAVLRSAIEGNNGGVFTTPGDSFAAVFGRVSDTVRSATEPQASLAETTWPDPALKVRLGLHLGEAENEAAPTSNPR
ncbi:MAG: class 3 adenylate cyclase [Candidatus Aldehydirespiratoraceae bacterium]|jgi:class 3 adenylate cyclase